MNKFLKNIFLDNGNYFRNTDRPVKSPMMDNFKPEEHFEYSPMKHQTLYKFILKFEQDLWIDSNQENNVMVKNDCRTLVVKRLHHEIFGDIESYLHELQLHLHNQDFESSKQTVDLIKAAIKGDDK